MKMEFEISLSITSIACAFLLGATISWAVREKLVRRMRRFPPGPTSMPVIGNLHNLSGHPHKALAELSRAHGPLMFLQLGFIKTVVVTSPEVARQVLQKKDSTFSSRTVADAISLDHRHAHFSISLIAAGRRWCTLREIFNTQLFSNKSLDANQDTRMKNIKDMVSYVERCSHAGVIVNVGQTVFDMALNLLSNTIFSIDIVDPNWELSKEFKQLTRGIVRDIAEPNVNLSDFFPIFKMVDPQGIRRRMTAQLKRLLNILDEIIKQRLASTSQGRHDVLDALINICRHNTRGFSASSDSPYASSMYN